MSLVNNTQPPTNGPPGAMHGASDAHYKGHLVSTGYYRHDKTFRVFIHHSDAATFQHWCNNYLCNNNQVISNNLPVRSPAVTVIEHGWFRDLAIFHQICTAHPVPVGLSSRATFNAWRDGLLAFLDANHAGGLWARVD
jgi:hypothetical protein